MTTEDIVYQWLSIYANREKLPKIMYPKQIYDFIMANASVFFFDGEPFTAVAFFCGNYQIILKPEEKETT